MVAAILTKPGERGSAAGETIKIETTYRKETIDNFLDMINNIFPNNMMDAFFRQTTTNITKDADNKSHYGTTMIEGTNMLGLVSISIFIGLAMKTMGHLNKPLLDVIVVFGHVTFVIVNLIMMAAPLLLIFLVAGNTMKIEIKEFLTSMGFYALVTSLTQLAYFFIVYPLIIFIFGRTNPFKFYLGFLDGITTSFAVGSSMASLPVAIKCLDEKMGYDANLVSFVVPVCIATSKDGAAINIGFSAIFLAQYTKKALSVSDYCLIALFSLTLSVAAPGVPQGVVLMLMVVLEALGISPEYASTIIAVDIIVDRIVTMLNVTGSAVCVSVVDNFTRKKRAQFDKEREQSATNFKAETTEDIPTENPVENEN
ncbi:hypothetical protein L9F63_003848 [Diploptera punctata]|uniref:Amino acid transporter n=1 Tax=Diploptera punctata TaxID=6984 RepID=A0AAD7ZJE3_DIPPU|nr:hypothetical protein L9F63_003848 [Diploptera punctata]